VTALVDIRIVTIPQSIIAETHALLRESGIEGYEAIALWAGTFSAGSQFDVSAVIRPAQRATRTNDGLLASVDGTELFRVNKLLNDRGLRLLAQLHTHPTDAYHSDTDDTFPLLSARGSLSIVVPDFARDPLSFDKCAVYQLEAGNVWRELVLAHVRSLICVVDDAEGKEDVEDTSG
jgi:hypothetical protein